MLEALQQQEKKQFKTISNLIKEEQETARYPTSFKLPIGIQYELTASCNLRCLHCYNDSGSETKKTTMGLENWLELTQQLIDAGGLFECILSGGEPLLLGDGLLEIIDLFARDNTLITLITNGFLFDQSWADKLSRYRNLNLRLSIDGYNAQLHDHLRQVPGSFQKAVNAAGLCSKEGIPFNISTCVTPMSLDSLEEMAKLAEELGATSLGVEMVLLSGRAANNIHLLINQSQQNILAKAVFELNSKHSLPIIYGTGYYAINYHQSGFPCKNLVIRPNGDVRLTCQAPFVIGNVLKQNILQIWREKGIHAWGRSEVKKFLAEVNQITAEYPGLINHKEDIYL